MTNQPQVTALTSDATKFAPAVLLHTIDGSGTAVPVQQGTAGSPSGGVQSVQEVGALLTGTGTTADPAVIDGSLNTAGSTIIALLKGLVTFASSTAAVPTIATPTATGSLLSTSVVVAASNNATALKASPGQVYSISAYCVAAYPVYLKFYNKASAPSPGSDTPVFVVAVPIAGSGVVVNLPTGLNFTTGIAYAVVKGISATDNTSAAAADAVVSIGYL